MIGVYDLREILHERFQRAAILKRDKSVIFNCDTNMLLPSLTLNKILFSNISSFRIMTVHNKNNMYREMDKNIHLRLMIIL